MELDHTTAVADLRRASEWITGLQEDFGHFDNAQESVCDINNAADYFESNGLIEAIRRVQNMRDAAEVELKRILLDPIYRAYEEGNENVWEWPEERLNEAWAKDGDHHDFGLPEWARGEDYEAVEANLAEQGTLDRVLDVLQLLAHGETPAQGEEA